MLKINNLLKDMRVFTDKIEYLDRPSSNKKLSINFIGKFKNQTKFTIDVYLNGANLEFFISRYGKGDKKEMLRFFVVNEIDSFELFKKWLIPIERNYKLDRILC